MYIHRAGVLFDGVIVIHTFLHLLFLTFQKGLRVNWGIFNLVLFCNGRLTLHDGHDIKIDPAMPLVLFPVLLLPTRGSFYSTGLPPAGSSRSWKQWHQTWVPCPPTAQVPVHLRVPSCTELWTCQVLFPPLGFGLCCVLCVECPFPSSSEWELWEPKLWVRPGFKFTWHPCPLSTSLCPVFPRNVTLIFSMVL